MLNLNKHYCVNLTCFTLFLCFINIKVLLSVLVSMISRPQRYPYQNFNVTNLLLTRPSAHNWREWRCMDGPRTSTPLPVAFPAAPVQPPPYSRADPLQPAFLTQPPPAYREAVWELPIVSYTVPRAWTGLSPGSSTTMCFIELLHT